MLLPVEWLLVLFIILTGILYLGLDVALPARPGSWTTKDPLLFYVKQLLTAVYLYCHLLIGLLAFSALRFTWENRTAIRNAPWGSHWQTVTARFSLRAVGSDLRLINAPLVMMTLFALMKHLIPHVNPLVLDEWFLAPERPLCGGVSCSEYLQTLIGKSPVIISTVGEHYGWYYPYLAIIILVFVFFAPRRLAEEFIFAFVGIFLFGTLMVYLAPTWGPIYYTPSPFAFMKGSEIYGLQQRLWEMKTILEQGRSSGEEIFMISGFPSLHVAVTVLGSIYLGSVSRLLAFLSWIFVVLTLNSTIYLGWHYVLDNIGAVVLVLLVRALAGRIGSRTTE